MISDARVLAVVPARSGSTGIPDKNLQVVGDRSLLGHAATVLGACDWVDSAVVSTDDDRYRAEAERYGLPAPFLRPVELAGPEAPALDTVVHALHSVESASEQRFDVVLIVEPTSPGRMPADLLAATDLLLNDDATDSVVTVSPIEAKHHPRKLLEVRAGALVHHRPEGASVVARQQLSGAYFARNGVCYALRRRCLTDRLGIITDRTLPLVIDRPLANIDTPLDLEWARFLHEQGPT